MVEFFFSIFFFFRVPPHPHVGPRRAGLVARCRCCCYAAPHFLAPPVLPLASQRAAWHELRLDVYEERVVAQVLPRAETRGEPARRRSWGVSATENRRLGEASPGKDGRSPPKRRVYWAKPPKVSGLLGEAPKSVGFTGRSPPSFPTRLCARCLLSQRERVVLLDTRLHREPFLVPPPPRAPELSGELASPCSAQVRAAENALNALSPTPCR